MKQTENELRASTPARIAVGRAGVRAKTDEVLSFRYDHAAAVDAVYGEVSETVLSELGLFTVHTLATDKDVYLRRSSRTHQETMHKGSYRSNSCIQWIECECHQ